MDKKRTTFRPAVTPLHSRDVHIGSLRELGRTAHKSQDKTDGQKFVDVVTDLVRERKLTLRDLGRHIDLSTLYKDFRGIDLNYLAFDAKRGETREVSTSAFSLIGGLTAVAEIQDAYDEVGGISDQLTERLEDSNEISIVAAIRDSDNDVDRINEGGDYPLIGGSEDSVEIRDNKNGRRVEFPEEFFLRNNLSIVVSRLSNLGKLARRHEERITIKRIADVTGSNTTAAAAPYAYMPRVAGVVTGTALYGTTAKTRIAANRVINNPLQGVDNIEYALLALGRATDSDGVTPIPVNFANLRILCPWELGFAAMKTVDSSLVPGVENANNPYGPNGAFSLTGKVIASEYLSYHCRTTWYLGAFKDQFVKKVAWDLGVESGTDIGSKLRNGIALIVRAGWNINVGATDYVYVIQNLAADTYTPTV